MSYIKPKSNGLTKIGIRLLQQAIESYVYCVLDAQARTRWAILIEELNLLKDVFMKLVEDTIAEDDVTVSISNMQQAISDTNGFLNMVITPGLVLVPSDMIIITEKMPGYNNILTLATGGMKFGTNINVNVPIKPPSSPPSPLKVETKKTPTPVKRFVSTVVNPPTPGDSEGTNTIVYITCGVVVSVITRYIVKLLLVHV